MFEYVCVEERQSARERDVQGSIRLFKKKKLLSNTIVCPL